MDENAENVDVHVEIAKGESENKIFRNTDSKTDESDIMQAKINPENCDIFEAAPRDGASATFLAGENKFADDLTLPIIENEEIVEFKADPIELEYEEIELKNSENDDSTSPDMHVKEEPKESDDDKIDECQSMDSNSSNKMKIMDDDKEEAKSESTEDPDALEKPNGSSDHNDKTERPHAEITEDKTNDAEINYADIDTLSEKNKRKIEDEETSVKRLKHEIHENFQQRDKLLNELLEIMDCDNLDQLASYSDQIVAEIGTLNELAKEKETEWNNVVHLKKLKEELLIRVERKKQLALLNGEKLDDGRDFAEMYIRNNQSVVARANLAKDRAPKYPLPNGLDLRQGIKRPILDVQSIIADYRQRHPETVPRRGRRIRSGAQNGTTNGNAGILNFSSMALGSGAQVRHNDMGNELNLLLNALENNRDNANAKEKHNSENASFKDMLVQLAKLSQNERNEILQNAIKPPPPYPEVTVHPVPNSPPSNSLLHGILTKAASSKSNNKTSFSPTLARLLTAPERSNVTSTPSITGHVNSNMSLSDILSTNKARNEITITPVGNQFDGSLKAKMEDEEAEDSADRLVIDESNEIDGRKGDTGSDTGDEVPQCQGCNQKTAQFVCAGCGNQWYCSRDCQVAAWDEHSEVCSG